MALESAKNSGVKGRIEKKREKWNMSHEWNMSHVTACQNVTSAQGRGVNHID